MSDTFKAALAQLSDVALGVKAGYGDFGADASFLSSGLGSNLSSISRPQQAVWHAAEQLRHATGRVWTAIRPQAQAIARQPLHVGVRTSKPESKRRFGDWWRKTYNTDPGARALDLAWRARCVKLHKTLPTPLKNFAENVDIIEEHPFLDAMRDPNPIQVYAQLVHMCVAHLKLTGRSFWWFNPLADDDEGLYDCMATPPSWVTPIHGAEARELAQQYLARDSDQSRELERYLAEIDENRLSALYKIRVPGAATLAIVPGELICPIGYSDMSNPLGWHSPLQAQSRAVVSDESISEAQYKSFRNGHFPGLMITVGRHPEISPGVPGARPMLTKEQRQEITNWINIAHRGVSRMDAPLIVDALIEKVERLTSTPREMDFMKSADVTQQRIDEGLGTNPIVVGRVEGSNRASSATAEDHFCFPANANVLTPSGGKPIEEIIPGDLVMTHRGRARPVTQAMRRAFSGNLCRIHVASPNWPMDVTPGHPVLVRGVGGAVSWKESDEIRRGDYLGFPRLECAESARVCVADYFEVGVSKESARVGSKRVGIKGYRVASRGLPEEFEITKEIAWVLGLYLAEGHCGLSCGIVWSCHRDEVESFKPRIDEALAQLGSAPTKVSQYDRNACQLYARNATLAALVLKLLGKHASKKHLPPNAASWPDEIKQAFVGGYLEGDGNIASRSVSFVTVSPSIARGMRSLINGLGVPCSISEHTSKEHYLKGRLLRAGRFYIGRVNAGWRDVARWMGVEFSGDWKRGTSKYLATDDFVWFPVEAIESLPHKGWVYNLGVYEDESYVTDFGAVHNCNWTVNPDIELISQCLTKWVGPLYSDGKDDLLIWIEPAKAMDPDEERAEATFLYNAGAKSVNMLLSDRGLPPVAGGDVAYIPQGLQPIPVHGVGEEPDLPEALTNPPQPPAPPTGGAPNGQEPPKQPKPGQQQPGTAKPPKNPDAKPPKEPKEFLDEILNLPGLSRKERRLVERVFDRTDAAVKIVKYNDNQERDDHGRFAAGGGSGGSIAGAGESAGAARADCGSASCERMASQVHDAVERVAAKMGGVHSKADLHTFVENLSADQGEAITKLMDKLPQNPRPTKKLHEGDLAKGIPTIWGLGWGPEQGTDIHDHADSMAGIHVLRGRVGETFYLPENKATGLEDSKRDKGVRSNDHEHDLSAGSTISIPAPYIHEMHGAWGGEALTVHAYYPPLNKMNYFTRDASGNLHHDGEWEEGRLYTGPPRKSSDGKTTEPFPCGCQIRHKYSDDQPRDEHGRFAGGGEHGAGAVAEKLGDILLDALSIIAEGPKEDEAKDAHGVDGLGHKEAGFLERIGKATWDVFKNAEGGPDSVTRAIADWTAQKIGPSVSKLPGALRSVVGGLWRCLRMGSRASYAAYTAGQAVAEHSALAHGADEATARRLRGVVSSIDVFGRGLVSAGLSAAGVHGTANAAISLAVPVGSLTYLAYSTAKNPVATYQAAKSAVSAAWQGKKSAAIEATDSILDGLTAGGDWWMALFLTAMDETKNVDQALVLTNRVYAEQPNDPGE